MRLGKRARSKDELIHQYALLLGDTIRESVKHEHEAIRLKSVLTEILSVSDHGSRAYELAAAALWWEER